MRGNVGVAWLGLVLFVLCGGMINQALAGPDCDKKPDNPSCPGGGGGGVPPPIESDPAYAYEYGRSIYVMNADGTAPIEFLAGVRSKGRNNPGTSYSVPKWDPTGTYLGYKRNEILERISLDTGESQSLLAPGVTAGDYSWSADSVHGQWIVFAGSIVPTRGDLFASIAEPESGPAKLVTEASLPDPALEYGPFYLEPSWSGDGTRLAFRHWSFEPAEVFDILVCDAFAGARVEPTCDSANTVVWRESDNSHFIAPVWNPAIDVIAYVPQGVEMFIESVDGAEIVNGKSCIQLYNSNPNRTPPVLRPDCVAKDVGNFFFGGDFDWSCDGQSLVVTGNYDDGDPETAGNWGIHRVDSVLDAVDLDLTDDLIPLITVDTNAEVPGSPSSRCTAD